MTSEPKRAEDERALLGSGLCAYSIEVTPRQAQRISSFRAWLPIGTRVYVPHIEGHAFDDVLATAKRLVDEGYEAMPHLPARLIPDAESLTRWVGRYREEAGVRQALVLGGGVALPLGPFHSAGQLLDSGVFDRFGFGRLHLAAHPEGNRDIDPDGSTRMADAALISKQAFALRTDAQIALVTQFGFDLKAVIRWADRIQGLGVDLPVHVGLSGPARLPTLIKYGLSCGVGPSLKVIQRRARDFTRLLLPYEPDEMMAQLLTHRAERPSTLLRHLHVFSLGGFESAASWFNQQLGLQTAAASDQET
jgi:methylenetetrahydrofolate reductase (NADPH)